MLKKLVSFARAAWGRTAFERDLDDEMRFHLEARAAHFVQEGLAPDEAAQRARREFGNVTLDAFLSAAIVATLAVGIGATAAMFSAVNAALLRPLPFPDPSQLVMVFGGTDGPLSVFGPDYTEWRANCRVCSDMAAMAQWQSTVAGGAQPERVLTGRVTASFFTTVGVQPMLGRGFLAGEMGRGLLGNIEQPVENAAVILGASLWRRQFGGDPAIVGKTIRIEGDPTPATARWRPACSSSVNRSRIASGPDRVPSGGTSASGATRGKSSASSPTSSRMGWAKARCLPCMRRSSRSPTGGAGWSA